MLTDGASLYGQGLSFPPRVGLDGHLVWSDGEPNVQECIRIILCTRPGERILRPEFGCNLDRFLFEPNTVSTLRLIQEEVKQALMRWEPRLKLNDVVVATSTLDTRAVDITIAYTLIATQVEERLNVTMLLQN